MANDHSTITITFTHDNVAYTLASCSISGKTGDSDAWLESCPGGLKQMTDFEIGQLRRLTAMVPVWLDDGAGRVSAIQPDGYRHYAMNVLEAARAVEAAADEESEAAAMWRLHEVMHPRRK